MPVPPAILSQFQQAMSQDRYAQARSLAERAVALAPADGVAHDMLRSALVGLTNYALALVSARKVTELMPEHAGGWSSTGSLLASLGQKSEAVECFRRAMELEPDKVGHHVEYATALINAKKLVEAEKHIRAAMQQFPADTGLVFRLAATLAEQGRPDDAALALGDALFADQGNLHLAMTMCANSNYGSGTDRASIIARHKNLGRLVMLADPRTPLKHTPPKPGPAPGKLGAPGRGKDGRVRVGILSSDLREHSVAWFIEPVLTFLDRSRFELVCYCSDPREDSVTRRLQRAVALGPAAWEIDEPPPIPADNAPPKGWRRVAMMEGYKAAKVIADDRIDILIELNGLTTGSRWDTLRLKPTPIQITYCGYPHTTGLPTVDYRIIDSITDPPGTLADASAVEKLVRLDPCFLCYRPPRGEDAPASRGDGAPPNPGAITFGSFNNLTKLSEFTLRTWAEVLARVPGSRLMLKGTSLSDSAVREFTLGRLGAAGIDAEHVTLLPGAPSTRSHLELYQQMDIALDTFPYAGTTTTCEALFMGVPVVSLARAWDDDGCHSERVGASLLSCVGDSDLIAASAEEYVQIAARLASDTNRLRHEHQTLRDRLIASPLCDAKGFGMRFSDLLEGVWRAWAKV